jgi:exopolysaccharide biosynthesis polyprenyl glycosylphosphotransferase
MRESLTKGADDAPSAAIRSQPVKSLPTRRTVITLPQGRDRPDWHPVRGRAALKRWANLAVVGSQIAIDALMIVVSFVTAYKLRFRIDLFSAFAPPSPQTYEIMLGLSLLTLLATINFFGLYSLRRGVSRIDQFYRVTSAVSVGLGASLALNSFVLGNRFIYSRQILLIAWILCIALVTAGRFAHGNAVGLLRRRVVARDRLLIVGTGSTGKHVLETITRSPWLGYEIVGMLTHAGTHASTREERTGALADLPEVPLLGDDSELATLVARHSIDEVIIALNGTPHEEVLALTQTLIEAPVNVKVYPDTFQLITKNELSLDDLGGLPMVSVRNVALRGWNRVVKRAMDVVLSALVLVFASPVLLVLAALVKLTSPGPVFHLQERVGHDGRTFLCIKLRSMTEGAEEATGPIWATRDDPRRTRLGRFMRRYSLDELPQFINVLLGEMSIVGPRPERPHFVEQFRQSIPGYNYRHNEKAGITGWAQVNGLRGDTSIEERTRYDLYYVENWSPLFDLKIMIKTLWLVLLPDDNAY